MGRNRWRNLIYLEGKTMGASDWFVHESKDMDSGRVEYGYHRECGLTVQHVHIAAKGLDRNVYAVRIDCADAGVARDLFLAVCKSLAIREGRSDGAT